MGRFKFYPRFRIWSKRGWHRLPLNYNTQDEDPEFIKKHPRRNMTFRSEWESRGPTANARQVIGDYIGRRHPRVLRHYQWKKRKELVKFHHKVKETKHALGNEDWARELASYM